MSSEHQKASPRANPREEKCAEEFEAHVDLNQSKCAAALPQFLSTVSKSIWYVRTLASTPVDCVYSADSDQRCTEKSSE